MKNYLVGGAVRDRLLGITNKDKDWVVVGATPDEIMAMGYQQVGADFPVFLHPKTKEEYALARTERKSGKGYQGFVCDFSPEVTLEDDLKRRDLTINAMAMDDQGNIIDPFHGQSDLATKQLRHVSDAFSEDPLRVLRVARFHARFSCLGFQIAPETLALMKKIAQSNELTALATERVWQETAKALTENQPEVYFNTLQKTEALACLFPEIADPFGTTQSLPTDTEHQQSQFIEPLRADAGEHALRALAKAAELSKNIDTRFAALVHGVRRCKKALPSSLVAAEHGSLKDNAVAILCRRMKTPKSTRELAVLVTEYHLKTHRALALTPLETVDLLDSCDVWRRPERFEEFLLACEAIAYPLGNESDPSYPAKFFLKEAARIGREIDIKALQSSGHEGLALKQQIRLIRANKIRLIGA